jgi:hypothetical protein
LGAVSFAAGQLGGGPAETAEPKVRGARAAFDAVEERGEFDQLVPGIQKIEVEDLLPCHSVCRAEYTAKQGDGKPERRGDKKTPADGVSNPSAGNPTQTNSTQPKIQL